MSEGRAAVINFLKEYKNDDRFKFRKLQALLKGDEHRENIMRTINPDLEKDLVKRIDILINQNEPKKAEMFLQQLIKTSVNNPSVSNMEQSLILTQIGEIMLKRNKLLLAIDYFQQAKQKRKTIRNLVGFAQG